MKDIDTRASIRTKFIGPTNFRPSRISVADDTNAFNDTPRRLIVHWNHEFNTNENHAIAAQEWLDKHMAERAKKYNQRAVLSGPGLCFDNCYYWTWEWEDLNTAAA